MILLLKWTKNVYFYLDKLCGVYRYIGLSFFLRVWIFKIQANKNCIMENSNSISSSERMRVLDQIENQVYQMMGFANQALNEFGKDKPSIKNVENQVNQFLKSLDNVETNVSKQLQYLSKVSTLHPHEGSCYASNKVNQMGMQRLEHVRTCLNEMEHLKIQHKIELQKYQNSKSEKTEKKPEVEVKSEIG